MYVMSTRVRFGQVGDEGAGAPSRTYTLETQGGLNRSEIEPIREALESAGSALPVVSILVDLKIWCQFCSAPFEWGLPERRRGRARSGEKWPICPRCGRPPAPGADDTPPRCEEWSLYVDLGDQTEGNPDK